MKAGIVPKAGVQPGPGDVPLGEFMRRLASLHRLTFCSRAIAQLEAIDPDDRTTADELLLAKYREHALRLIADLGLQARTGT